MPDHDGRVPPIHVLFHMQKAVRPHYLLLRETTYTTLGEKAVCRTLE